MKNTFDEMDTMSAEEIEKIINKLEEHSFTKKCKKCKKGNYVLLDGYFSNIVYKRTKDLKYVKASYDGASMSIMCACKNCGHMDQYLIGYLLS